MLTNSLCLSPEGDASGNGGPPMITIRHGDQDIQIPKPDGIFTAAEVNEKYIPKAAHNDIMARQRKEADGYKGRKTPDELLEDQEFRAMAATRWGFDSSKSKQEFSEQLSKARQEIQEREVKPLSEKLDRAVGFVDELLVKTLRSNIVQAAAGKIDEKFLKAPGRGAKPLVVSMLEDMFEFDNEHGEWFAKGTGGNYAFSRKDPGEGAPYMGVDEFIESWLTTDGKEFAKDQRQGGPGAGSGGPGGGTGNVPGIVGKEMRLTREQIRDIPFFKRMEALAAQQGLTIVPV